MHSKSSMRILAFSMGGTNPTKKTHLHAIDEMLFPGWEMIGKVYSSSFKMCKMSLRLHGFIPITSTLDVEGMMFIHSL